MSSKPIEILGKQVQISNELLLDMILVRLESMTEKQLDILQADITFVLWDKHEVQTYIEKLK